MLTRRLLIAAVVSAGMLVACLATAPIPIHSPVWAADKGKMPPPTELTIKGDTRVDEIERQIVVKEKMTVVTSLPFTLVAPEGAFDYRWKYPSSITAKDDDGDTLEITNASKGIVTVSCRITTLKVVDGQVVTSRKVTEITFAIGEVIPPKPPIPPTPVDTFTKSLIDAYKAETAPNKAEIVAFFADLYRAAASTDVKDQTLTTLGQLYIRLVSARKRVYPDDSIILPIRKLIEAELNVLLKPVSDQPLDEETRTKAAAAFNRIAASLEAVK